MSRALRAAVRAVRGVWGMAGSAPTHCGATSSPLPPLAVRGVASVALHRQCALPATEEQGPVAPQRLGEFSKPPREAAHRLERTRTATHIQGFIIHPALWAPPSNRMART